MVALLVVLPSSFATAVHVRYRIHRRGFHVQLWSSRWSILLLIPAPPDGDCSTGKCRTYSATSNLHKGHLDCRSVNQGTIPEDEERRRTGTGWDNHMTRYSFKGGSGNKTYNLYEIDVHRVKIIMCRWWYRTVLYRVQNHPYIQHNNHRILLRVLW